MSSNLLLFILNNLIIHNVFCILGLFCFSLQTKSLQLENQSGKNIDAYTAASKIF
jgi:hypothetical protein